ncbi:MAG: NmrA family NAD(P)-binding protein [Brevinema sp.]
MGKILITGATGNVGNYVAKYACQNGDPILCAGTNIDRLKTLFGQNTDCVTFDFSKPSTFEAALHNVDRVFLIRPPHLGKPQDLYPFIDAMKAQNNIKLVSFLSLIGIEHNPIPPHYKIEKYIEKSGLPFCHLRPGFFMQNLSGIHAFEILHFDRVVVPVKNALTSFIDAEDIGELAAKILSQPENHQNKGYSITGYEAIDYWQVAQILSEELKRPITYANPSPRFAKKYWTDIRGLDKTYAFVMSMLYLMTRMGTAKQVTTVFEDIMGKKPQNFRQFVQKNLSAWTHMRGATLG